MFFHVYVVLIYENSLINSYNFYQVSANLSKLNPLYWSPYIQHCREDILTAAGNDSDIYLAHLLELQRISENIKNSGIRDFPSEPRTGNSHIGVHIKLLMSELQRFKASLPESLQHNCKSKITP